MNEATVNSEKVPIYFQRLIAIRTENWNVLHIPDEYFTSLTKTVERERTIISKYGGIYELMDYETIHQIYYDYLFTPLLTERYIELVHKDEKNLSWRKGNMLT